MESEEEIIFRSFEEFNPFLSNAVIYKLYPNEQKFEKRKLMSALIDEYKNNERFATDCKSGLIKAFDSKKISSPDVVKRIRDLSLLYAIDYKFKGGIRKGRKVNGRAFELVLESVLKWKLGENPKLYCEFVDWKVFDYLISDVTKNDWILGVQCKVSLYSYRNLLEDTKKLLSKFSDDKTFIVFCGSTKKAKMEDMRKAFKEANIKIYFLYTADNENDIDSSFYDLIDILEKI
jgi:hypothetical protein